MVLVGLFNLAERFDPGGASFSIFFFRWIFKKPLQKRLRNCGGRPINMVNSYCFFFCLRRVLHLN